ncbi:MAG: hypothetical protein AAF127_10600 [Pseudomonadota bacterium]
MEGWVIVTIAMFALGGGSAVWGMLDSILSHRKEMAELKLSEAAKREALSAENAQLTETVAEMQGRLAVLETIATDPARRTADAIEALR